MVEVEILALKEKEMEINNDLNLINLANKFNIILLMQMCNLNSI
jgi:hypothetical protein